MLPTFPGGSAGKESAFNAGDLGSIPGLGRLPGEGNGDPVFLPGESHGQRCYTVAPCWLSTLNIAVCTCPSQTP